MIAVLSVAHPSALLLPPATLQAMQESSQAELAQPHEDAQVAGGLGVVPDTVVAALMGGWLPPPACLMRCAHALQVGW